MKYAKYILFFTLSVFLCVGCSANQAHAVTLSCPGGSTQTSVSGVPKCLTQITPAASTGSNCPSGQTPQFGTVSSLNGGMVVGCLSDVISTPDPTPTPVVVQSQYTLGCYYYPGGYPQYIGPVPASGVCAPYNGQPAYILDGAGRPGTSVNNNLTYTPLEPLPGQSTQSSNFCQLLNLVFKYLIYLGGAIAVLFLVLGGIGYMVFEVVNKRTQARERIKSSVIGLLVLLGSWIILSTVNPTLVNACNVLSPTTTGVISSDASNAGAQQAAQAQALYQAEQACQNSLGTRTIQTIPAGSPTQSCSILTPSCSGILSGVVRVVNAGICCDIISQPTATSPGLTCLGS